MEMEADPIMAVPCRRFGDEVFDGVAARQLLRVTKSGADVKRGVSVFKDAMGGEAVVLCFRQLLPGQRMDRAEPRCRPLLPVVSVSLE